jgi:hypothetical protein
VIRRIFLLTATLLLLVRAYAQQPVPPQTVSAAAELTPIIVDDGQHTGEAEVKLDIDASGNIASLVPVSVSPDLVEPAAQATRTFRFTSHAGETGLVQHITFVFGKQVKTVAPVYPPIARAAHVQGNVELAAVIDPQGIVQSISTISGPPMLVGSAKMSLQQWVFPPAQVAGSPVTAHAIVVIHFSLR